MEVCISGGHFLAASSLKGWRLHHDPNMAKSGNFEREPIEGNRNRDMWKYSSWQIAAEPLCDDFKKATHAALSGNVKKVLPVCRSWYDYVWAYFKTLVDVEVEKVLHRRPAPDGREWVELPPEYWANVLCPHQIFKEVESSPSVAIHSQSQSHFHLVQKYIILDDMNGLLEQMVKWLPSCPSIHLLRFMAHIALVIRNLGRVREENQQVDVILKAYVEALTKGHYLSAVALYAGQLPPSSQVSCYARLLADVWEEQEQRKYLEMGKMAGLDVPMVTKAVVEHILSTGPEREECSGPAQLGQEITELDAKKINAIKWLLFEEVQRLEALRQANVLLRQFLSARKFSAAQAVLRKIPADSERVVSRVWHQEAGPIPLPPHIVADLTELQAIHTYMVGITAFNCWCEHFHHKKPTVPPQPPDESFREKVAYEFQTQQYEVRFQ
jgi:nuclear pore complex protein Nup107